MERRTLIAGNWKMFKTTGEAQATARELVNLIWGEEEIEVAICPPFTALATVADVVKETPLLLGAQNAHWEAEGAFTGEISLPMLKDCGCHLVILGHSERRNVFAESDEMIGRRLRGALASELTPILCVGEKLEEREAGRMEEVVLGQLERALEGVAAIERDRLIIAYEPVWAIGTGQTATPDMAQQVHGIIREWLGRRYSGEIASQVRILYGGSVKPENAGDLMRQQDLDGALVGGASLDARSFARIVEQSRK